MPNVANVNVNITATDKTGIAVSSALGNLGRLSGSFSSIGSIASGVFGGILGYATFRTIAGGIGNVVSSAFQLNNVIKASTLASESMVKTIADTEPVGTAAFGGLSEAANQFERTMREIRERESDGLEDYADSIDNIKNKILEAENEIEQKKLERLRKEAEAIEDLEVSHLRSILDVQSRIEDETLDFNERLYDLANQRADRLESIEERKNRDVEDLQGDLVDLQADLSLAATAMKAAEIQAKIELVEQEIAETISAYDAEIEEINTRADHEVEIATTKHERKLAALQTQLARENEDYDKRLARIKEDAAREIAIAEETAKKKIETLEKQLEQEKVQHQRFLRDIQEAYADAQAKMAADAGGGGGSGAMGSARTVNFGFDFAESFRAMKGTEIDKFLQEVQDKYIQIGIRSPFNIGDIQQFGKAVIQFTGGSSENMEKMVNMAQSLAAKNPMQGMYGATMAIVELLGSGNITSLARRFDIPKSTMGVLNEANSPTEAISLMEEALARQGITMGLVDAKIRTMGGAWENVKETFNVFSALTVESIFESLSKKLFDFNNFLIANQDIIGLWAGIIGGAVGTAVIGLIDGIIALGQGFINFFTGPGAGLLETFSELWETISVLVAPAIEFLSEVWGTAQRFIEETVVPSLGRIFNKLSELWKEIAPEVEKTLKFMSKWWNENSDKILATVKFIWGLIEFAITTVMEIVGAVIKVGLAIIRGDWDAAWTAIKDMFSGIWDNIKQLAISTWDAIGSTIRNGINGVIDSINGFIRGLNDKLGKTKIQIGGIKVGGWEIPEIPRLATGGIISRPTLAMLGEGGPEAVVPLGGRRSGLGEIQVLVTGNTILDDDMADTLADRVSYSLANKLALQGAFLKR